MFAFPGLTFVFVYFSYRRLVAKNCTDWDLNSDSLVVCHRLFPLRYGFGVVLAISTFTGHIILREAAKSEFRSDLAEQTSQFVRENMDILIQTPEPSRSTESGGTSAVNSDRELQSKPAESVKAPAPSTDIDDSAQRGPAKRENEGKAHSDYSSEESLTQLKNRRKQEDAEAGKVVDVLISDSETMQFCYCPPGSFTMGSPPGETNHFGEENPTDAVITTGFWMGRTEVTQAQWVAIMGQNPSGRRRSTFPVESVSAIGADKFVSQLNIKRPLGGRKWVLPSEAQWEYACRAGSSGPWGRRGDGIEGTLDDMGWHKFNSGSDIQDVATKNPNAWGLYDMHGNVSEWCADRWNLDSGLQGGNDPFGTKGTMRTIRGGHCHSEPAYCRSAKRSGNSPAHVDMWIGFRVAVVSNDPRSP